MQQAAVPTQNLWPDAARVGSSWVHRRRVQHRDIAKQFSISEETVEAPSVDIFDKTGVSTRLELALFAIAHQLVALQT